jgi:myosin heavy subunit
MGRLSEVVEVKVADLKPHPRNKELFNPPTEKELRGLMTSMRRIGQIDDVIISDDKKILSGHWRVEAARKLGWETIRAKVFYPEYEGEEERLFLDANLQRRYLHPMCYLKAEKELMKYLTEEELIEYLIPEFHSLARERRIQRKLLASIAQLDRAAQKEVYEEIEIISKLKQGKIGEKDLEAFRRLEDEKLKELEQQKDRLEKEVIKYRAMVEQLSKEKSGAEVKAQKAMERVSELEEKLQELEEEQKQLEEQKEEEQIRRLEEQIEKIKMALHRAKQAEQEAREEAKKKDARIVYLEEQIKLLEKKYQEEVEKQTEEIKKKFMEQMQKLAEEKKKLDEERKKLEKEVKEELEDKMTKHIQKIHYFLTAIELFEKNLEESVKYAEELSNSKYTEELIQKLKQLAEKVNQYLSFLSFCEREDSNS